MERQRREFGRYYLKNNLDRIDRIKKIFLPPRHKGTKDLFGFLNVSENS
jgi:hypothetical protein